MTTNVTIPLSWLKNLNDDLGELVSAAQAAIEHKALETKPKPALIIRKREDATTSDPIAAFEAARKSITEPFPAV